MFLLKNRCIFDIPFHSPYLLYKIFPFDASVNNPMMHGYTKVEKELINLDNTALVLVIIGALNWGSIGLFGVDLVGALFGGQLAPISRVIFTLVGIAGLWSISLLFKEKLPVRKS